MSSSARFEKSQTARHGPEGARRAAPVRAAGGSGARQGISACGVYRTDLHVVAIARLLCTGLIGWRSLVMGGWKGSRHLWLWRGRAYHRAGGPLAGPSGQSGGRGSYVLVQPRVEDSLSSPIWNAISDERPSAPETAPPGLYIGACP
jgi:hypothetical protein